MMLGSPRFAEREPVGTKRIATNLHERLPLDRTRRLTSVPQHAAHRATGLTIGAHSGQAQSAYEQLAELERVRVHPSSGIRIHAQNEPDASKYLAAARRGAYISLDGVSPESVAMHVDRVIRLRDANLLDRVLVSQHAGGYWVGEPGGRKFRPYDTACAEFIPALLDCGFSRARATRYSWEIAVPPSRCGRATGKIPARAPP